MLVPSKLNCSYEFDFVVITPNTQTGWVHK